MNNIVPVISALENTNQFIKEDSVLREMQNIFLRYKMKMQGVDAETILSSNVYKLTPVFIYSNDIKMFESAYKTLHTHRLILCNKFSPSIFGEYENVSSVSLNFDTEIKIILTYLNRLSKRNVVLFGGMSSKRFTSKYFILSFKRLSEKFGIKITDIIYEDNGIEEAWNTLARGLSGIKVIICYNTTSAVFLKRKLEGMGVHIPDDLYIISRGDKELALLEGITSIQWNEHVFARQCINLFLNLRKNRDISAINYTLKHEFLINKSTDFIPYEDLSVPSEIKYISKLNTDEGYLTVEKPMILMRSCDKSDFEIIKGIMNSETLVAMSLRIYLSEGAISHRISSYMQKLKLHSRKELCEFLTTNRDFINKYIISH